MEKSPQQSANKPKSESSQSPTREALADNKSIQRKPSVWRTVKAVAWSFVGLRAQGDYEKDIQTLSPLVIISVALVGIFIFVGFLIVLVNWIVP